MKFSELDYEQKEVILHISTQFGLVAQYIQMTINDDLDAWKKAFELKQKKAFENYKKHKLKP
jgi:hypothetical protein